MQRVAVIGGSCSGKTTVSRALDFGKIGSLVLDQADTVVWLDVPCATAVRRALRRTSSRFVQRTVLWNGNRERLRDVLGRNSMVWSVLKTHRGFAGRWEARLAGHPNVMRLRDAQSIQAIAAMSGSSGSSERQKTPPFVET